jgi:hypothetical protein
VEQEVEALITAGSQTLTAFQVAQSSGVVEIDGTTLTAGGEALTLSNSEVISVASNGAVVASQSGQAETTIPFSTTSLTMEKETILTAGSETFTAVETVIGGNKTEAIIQAAGTTETLSVGGPTGTVGAKVLSLASGGALVEGSSSTVAWSTVLEGTDGSIISGAEGVGPWSSPPSTSSTATSTVVGGSSSTNSGPGANSTKKASGGPRNIPVVRLSYVMGLLMLLVLFM